MEQPSGCPGYYSDHSCFLLPRGNPGAHHCAYHRRCSAHNGRHNRGYSHDCGYFRCNGYYRSNFRGHSYGRGYIRGNGYRRGYCRRYSHRLGFGSYGCRFHPNPQ